LGKLQPNSPTLTEKILDFGAGLHENHHSCFNLNLSQDEFEVDRQNLGNIQAIDCIYE
jgi:hypothetical protein